MSVGILLITHNRIGEELLRTAENFIGRSLSQVMTISIPGNLKPDHSITSLWKWDNKRVIWIRI